MMAIDFDSEITKINNRLKQAEGYLDCEKIITQHIQKQLDIGFDDGKIIEYLKKLSVWLYKNIETNEGNAECYNYRYAAGFVDTLLKMPYWRSWMKTIDK